jgi:hypothetical protein
MVGIAEEGDHQQLIADGGLYAKLYGHLQQVRCGGDPGTDPGGIVFGLGCAVRSSFYWFSPVLMQGIS